MRYTTAPRQAQPLILSKPRYELRQHASGQWQPFDTFPQEFCVEEKIYGNWQNGDRRVTAMNAAYERRMWE